MKITNPLFTKALGLFGATLIRGWTATLDYRIVYQDPTVDPVHPRCRPRVLYVLWHEYLLCPLGVRGRGMTVLISQHRDGELITQVLRHLGFKVVRGSSTRGGIAAVKKVLRSQGSGIRNQGSGIRSQESGVSPLCHSERSEESLQHAVETLRCAQGDKGSDSCRLTPDSPAPGKTHLIITPDGPRGPRRQLEEGAIYLAARLAMPIVCMGFAFDRPWRLNSWDQFAIPRPFSRARAVISSYLEIPPTLALPSRRRKNEDRGSRSREPSGTGPARLAGPTVESLVPSFEHYRLRLEQVLNHVTQEAEHWARAGNRKPGEMPILGNEVSATPPYAPAMACAHGRTQRDFGDAT
jgi:lysophospholipid acyltransferase (LPLAT)-like uncharacterized protein